MKKLLNAMASKLSVREVVKNDSRQDPTGVVSFNVQLFEHKAVTDDVRKTFIKEMENHLSTKVEKMKVGEYIEYGANYGDERPLGKLMEDINDNLSEVLLKLPTLDNEKTYYFPADTFIRFTITQKDEKEEMAHFKTSMSQWIYEAYCNQ